MTTPNPNAPTTITKEPIVVMASILQEELSLDDAHIMLEYQKNFIPKDSDLYVALVYLGPGKPIGNVNQTIPDGLGGLTEVQTLAMQHLIQVDFMSFSSAARIRKEEFYMALASIFSEQQQELYQMMIARNPGPFIDAGSFEATAYLNRFTTVVPMHAVHRKTKPSTYFDVFSAEFATETSGFIEADPALVPE